MQPSLVYMYNNTEGFDANRFCGIILGGDCGSAQELNSWEVTVPDGKPPVEQPKMPDVRSTLSSFHPGNLMTNFLHRPTRPR